MSWLDTILIVIVILSALFGVLRGFVREVLSLAGWFLSFFIALTFSGDLAVYFENSITRYDVRVGAAFVVLFLIILIISMVINRLMSKLVRLTGLGLVDRLIGFGFGVVRGEVIATILVFLCGITPLATEPAWNESFMVGYSEQLIDWVSGKFPKEEGGTQPPIRDIQ